MLVQVITAQFPRTQVLKFLARGCQLFETQKFWCSTSPRSNNSLTWWQLWACLCSVTQLVIFFTPSYTLYFLRIRLAPSHNFEDFLWGLIFLLLTGYILSYNCMQPFALRCKQGNSFCKLFWWAYKKSKLCASCFKTKFDHLHNCDNFVILQVGFVPTLPPKKLTWSKSLCQRWPTVLNGAEVTVVLIYVGSRWCKCEG